MKKARILCSLAAAALIFCSCNKKTVTVDEARLQKVVVYSYDSFISEWGPGPELEARFEAQSGYDLEFVNCDDGVQVVNRAIREKQAPQADVIVGIDNADAARALSEKLVTPYKPKDADSIKSELATALSNDWSITPYDWSHFALVYDTQAAVPAPTQLQDLTDSRYAKQLILLDPRTSTPGRGFAAWTLAVFGDTYLDFWRALKPNILTMASSWSSGYGLFTKGEAPLVISYTTSPAYHVENDKTDRYQALIFDEGHIMQVEGAGVVRGAPNEKGAKAFMDFLLSPEAQEVLPLTQWMYPANSNVELPDSYKKAAPVATKTLSVDAAAINDAVQNISNVFSE